MIKKIYLELIIILSIFFATWMVISYLPLFKAKTEIISYESETKLGEKLINNLLFNKSFKRIESLKLDSCMEIILNRLTDTLNSKYTYNIYVFRDEQLINAFAMPGGNIFISSGLIKFLNNAEELSAIIAHEIGHIEKRHVIKRLIKDIGITILTSGEKHIFEEVSKYSASAYYNREQEIEADDFALNLLEKSKINPRIFATIFRKFSENKLDYNIKFEFIMSHPHNKKRYRNSLKYKLKPNFKHENINLDWEMVKNNLSSI